MILRETGVMLRFLFYSRDMRVFRFKRLLILSSCAVTSIGFIIFLYAVAEVPNTYKNGFDRIFFSKKSGPDFFQSLPSKSMYFAGRTENTLFLGDYSQSNLIAQVDKGLGKPIIYLLPLRRKHMIYVNQVDSPVVFSSSSQDSVIETFFIGNEQVLSRNQLRVPARFTYVLPIDSEVFILRTVDTSAKENVLSRYKKNNYGVRNSNLLESQGNGFFSTDGTLSYDRRSGILIYVYFYRNQFLCMDSSLNLQYRAHTIDTNRWSKINIREVASSRLFTFSKPPVMINQKSFIYDERIYIQSGLLSDHENRQAFGKSSVVDTYDSKTGQYVKSFYIPDFDGYKVHDFVIWNRSIFALQGEFIVHYVLPSDP